MLTYKLLSENEDGYMYLYYPDANTDAPGIVFISKDKKSFDYISISTNDIGTRYAHHAVKGIDTNTIEGTVAWY